MVFALVPSSFRLFPGGSDTTFGTIMLRLGFGQGQRVDPEAFAPEAQGWAPFSSEESGDLYGEVVWPGAYLSAKPDGIARFLPLCSKVTRNGHN
jgi:hypothetical protein